MERIIIITGKGFAMETIKIKNWSEFREWIDQDQQQIMPIYWRGQKDPSWPLASRFERLILAMNGGWKDGASCIYPYDDRYKRDGRNLWAPGFYQDMRNRYLEVFMRACAGLRGPAPATLDHHQWWALGRHHGLITPLLDWTESPYIAAFFALSGEYQEMKAKGKGSGISYDVQGIAVYRLFHNECLKGDGLRVVKPILDELGRLQGQRGLFTWLDSEEYFELQGFLDNNGREDLLKQFIISVQAVVEGLHDLKAHGIDWRLLFPDLFGAAEQANFQYDLY